MSINYIEKGIGLFDAIEAAGHMLYNLNGVWCSDNDVAVQAIIDAYTEDPIRDANSGIEPHAHVNRMIEVDNSRTDEYIANGSRLLPYKTIQAAIDAIPSETSQDNRYDIHIAAGVYTENVILAKPYVTLTGDGWVETCIKGDLTITADGITDWRNSVSLMKIGGSALSGHNHVTVSVTAQTPTADTTINFKNCYIRDWDCIGTIFTATCNDVSKISLNFFESYFGDSQVSITKCSVYTINTSWGPSTTLYDGANIWQIGGWQLGAITLQNDAYVTTQCCPQLDPGWAYLSWVVNAGCTLCLDDAVESTSTSITGVGTIVRLGKMNTKASLSGASFTGSVSAPHFQCDPQAEFPSPLPGQIMFNSTDNHFYGYNGTTWKQLDN